MKKIPTPILMVLLVLFGVFLGFIVLPKAISIVAPWGINELALVLTVVGVIVALAVPVIDDYFARKRDIRLEEKEEKNKRSVYVINLNVTTLENNNVLFSASIQNVGDVQIETQIANLYIDQGVPKVLVNDRNSEDVGVVYYDFPFILEHKEEIDGRPDCVLCKKCFREHNTAYPEEVVSAALKGGEGHEKLLRTHYTLDHLSSKSIKYIMPKEQFSEDVVIQFKNAGVYRATLFVGAEGTADCVCATKQFYIPQNAR